MCFALGIAITGKPCCTSFSAFFYCWINFFPLGPLIAFQAFHNHGHSHGQDQIPDTNSRLSAFIPRPFALSLLTGRSSKASDYSHSQQGCPVAGNGFEPVNGYDFPFSPYLPGSFEPANSKVKSVAYGQQHWTAGAVTGDVVTASQGIIGRAANMMSPKPRLQVLSPSLDDRRNNDTRFARASNDTFEEENSISRSEATIEQDMSGMSVIIPGAMPYSPDSSMKRMSLCLQSRRRINTIYEGDSYNSSQGSHPSE